MKTGPPKCNEQEVIGAFTSFLDDLRRAYPYSYGAGDFDRTIEILKNISRSDNEFVVELSDDFVRIARLSCHPSERRLRFKHRLKQFDREMTDDD